MNSTTHTAGQDFLASHYNDLRNDSMIMGGEYVVATGSANAFVVALDAQVTSYTTGMKVCFKANHTVTGATTINVNSIGVKTIKDGLGNTIVSGKIRSGSIIVCIYDGTDFLILSGSVSADGIITSSNLKQSADTARTDSVTTAPGTKKKEIEISKHYMSGTISVSFDYRYVSGLSANAVNAQIYKNGVAVGTARSTASTSFTTYTETITGVVGGDLIQLYVWGNGFNPVVDECRNFRIYYDEVYISYDPTVILD